MWRMMVFVRIYCLCGICKVVLVVDTSLLWSLGSGCSATCVLYGEPSSGNISTTAVSKYGTPQYFFLYQVCVFQPWYVRIPPDNCVIGLLIGLGVMLKVLLYYI